MRAAGVLDGLGGEEEGGVWCCLVGSVLRGGGGCWGVGFAEVFEEEDYAVDGAIYFFFFVFVSMLLYGMGLYS